MKPTMRPLVLLCATSFFVPACRNRAANEQQQAQTKRASYDAATIYVEDESATAFSHPRPDLDERERASFFVGNSYFNQNWIFAPASVDTRDGLGPLFHARSCSGCHFRDGRAQPPTETQAHLGLLFRLSDSAQPRGPHGEASEVAIYGGQLQDHGAPGHQAEATTQISYSIESGSYDDGESYELHRPKIIFSNWSMGAPPETLLVSPRIAGQMIGLGLLAEISEQWLNRIADPDDLNHDGISGKINQVWDVAKQALTIGRFGWKAEQPSVKQQTAGAFNGDLGLTTSIFPNDNHSEVQVEGRPWASGGDPEVPDAILDSVAFYASSLAVPAARNANDPRFAAGSTIFDTLGCDACHQRNIEIEHKVAPSGSKTLSISPYTDLLLHDLGEGLSDARPSYLAQGSEWRTPPLWGLGLVPKVNGHLRLLHDGRADGFAQAIIWHNGEAAPAKMRFLALSKSERDALLFFLESI